MAGRIPDRDIAAIRERTRIEDIVGEHVQLRRAGADSLKGLCPFHDEKSPSFHVRPNHGQFHCFGCGEGGDVYAFVQKIEHVTFVEAVELLADRLNFTISYEGSSTTNVQRDKGSRSRLLAANAAAQEFYAEALQSAEAAAARQYLIDRNFDAEAAKRFGCGFAPSGWDTLTKHLLRKGFTFKELEAAGLSREGRRGPMDRFHRRLLWPIRGATSEVIGFGARRLFDDDQMEAKYVNTPETVLYKKSNVLFGLDLAKRDIAKGHQAVVVEGYTDVMAMHLAGVTTAVASCGTAFGDEHLSMLRRLMMDDNFFRGELIYVFDGDAAGRAAAVKAFEGEQNLTGQSFVAVASDGMDPCDLRLQSGDSALRDLVARRTPLFEFVIRTALEDHDLDSAEGRVAALRRCVPLAARIKDPTLRDEYARQLAGWVGWDDVAQVIARVRETAKSGPATSKRDSRRPSAPSAPAATAVGRPNPKDSDPVAAAGGTQVGAAAPGDGRPGVRRAARRQLHPSRVRGSPAGDHHRRRHGLGAGRRGMDRGRARGRAGRGEPDHRTIGRGVPGGRGQAAAVHRERAGPAARGVGGPRDRGIEVETAAHVAGGAEHRVPRPVRRSGRHGAVPAQPVAAGQRRRPQLSLSVGGNTLL
ncbi:DNA primase [Mycolicibacterium aubagnense]